MRGVGNAAEGRDGGDEDQAAVVALEQIADRRLRAFERARSG